MYIPTRITVAAIALAAAVEAGHAAPSDRWTLESGPSIVWKIAGSQLPHADFIEQGGRRAGQKVWYSIHADGTLELQRDVVWPSLRVFPNNTLGSLIKHYAAEAEPKISVNGTPLGPIKVSEVRLDGTLTFVGKAGPLGVTRETFPSVEDYTAIDRWTLTNAGEKAVTVAVAPLALSAEKIGPYGKNLMSVSCGGLAKVELKPGAATDFFIVFAGRQADHPEVKYGEDVTYGGVEDVLRRMFIIDLNESLRLETPDPVLDRAFTFAKWRVAEAMNDTRGGLMLAPGNLR